MFVLLFATDTPPVPLGTPAIDGTNGARFKSYDKLQWAPSHELWAVGRFGKSRGQSLCLLSVVDLSKLSSQMVMFQVLARTSIVVRKTVAKERH